MASVQTVESQRESKGERTRRRIMGEAHAMIDEMGIEAISQEAVARRVGITQSALRHHFPTKEGMFDAIFENVFSDFYRSAEQILLEPGVEPRERLMKFCTLHLGYVMRESDRVALESYAHYLRSSDLLLRQSSWYHWIAGHYTALLGTIRPDLDEPTRQGRALAILTLCIGAWVTVGRSHPQWPTMSGDAVNGALFSAIEHLVDR